MGGRGRSRESTSVRPVFLSGYTPTWYIYFADVTANGRYPTSDKRFAAGMDGCKLYCVVNLTSNSCSVRFNRLVGFAVPSPLQMATHICKLTSPSRNPVALTLTHKLPFDPSQLGYPGPRSPNQFTTPLRNYTVSLSVSPTVPPLPHHALSISELPSVAPHTDSWGLEIFLRSVMLRSR